MSRILVVALLALLPGAVLADTPIDETRALTPGALVQIENIHGRIQVSAWDRAEAHIGGSLGKGVERLLVEGSGDRLRVKVVYPEQQGWFGGMQHQPTDLVIRLPRQVALEVESVSASVDIAGTEGKRLRVESVSGSVSIDAAAAEADVETVSGDHDLRIRTADLDVESVSGDIRVRGVSGGRVKAEAVSGAIRIEAGTLEQFAASTVSGDITLDAAMAADGRIGVESLSGDVEVKLDRAASARVKASSFNGNIRSDVGKPESAEYGPGSSLEATIGDGSGRIDLETFSGNIELRFGN